MRTGEEEVPKRLYQLTRAELENGVNSRFWLAITERLLEFVNDINFELHDSQNDTDYGTFKRLGGNMETVKRVLDLPNMMLIDIEEDKK